MRRCRIGFVLAGAAAFLASVAWVFCCGDSPVQKSGDWWLGEIYDRDDAAALEDIMDLKPPDGAFLYEKQQRSFWTAMLCRRSFQCFALALEREERFAPDSGVSALEFLYLCPNGAQREHFLRLVRQHLLERGETFIPPKEERPVPQSRSRRVISSSGNGRQEKDWFPDFAFRLNQERRATTGPFLFQFNRYLEELLMLSAEVWRGWEAPLAEYGDAVAEPAPTPSTSSSPATPTRTTCSAAARPSARRAP